MCADQVRIQFVADFGTKRGQTQPPVLLDPDYDTIMKKAHHDLKPRGGKRAANDYILVLKEAGGSCKIVRGRDGRAIPLGRALVDGAVIVLTTEEPAGMPIPLDMHVCIACRGIGLLLHEPCPLCDGACAFPDDDDKDAGTHWPDAPVIQGRGRHEGVPPRGAGIIALCEIRGKLYVCVCEKNRGKASFPKGGLDGNSVLVGAKREWSEEAGLSLSRLTLLQGASLDEPRIGCRYLLARCEPAEANSEEPDVDSMEWKPPFEDPCDPDPIVKSRWVPVREVLSSGANLTDDRRQLLEQAIEKLNAGGNFIVA